MTLIARISALITAIGLDIKALFLRVLPPGGTTGQVLGKSSNADYAVGWVTPSGGSGGGSSFTAVTANLPGKKSDTLVQITDAAVLATSKIAVFPGMYTRADQNDGENERIKALEVTEVADGSFVLRVVSLGPVAGPFKFLYLITS